MKKITFTKKALALLLALAMVVSGIYIPRSNVKIVQAAEDETEATGNIEEPAEQTAVPENAVAKIGDNYYETFETAITAANGAESDVTVTLLKNITASSAFTFNNTSKKKITIDGNGCTVTAGTTVTNLFNVQCEFELKNVIVDYKGTNAAIVINAATTTSLTNVTINAENVGPNANSYLKDAIIDVCAAGEHTLNLTNTNITVIGPAGTDLNSTFYPIIRTNAGLANDASIDAKTRIVTMNLTNSTLDASAAVGRLGIWVTRGTQGNVILDNSHIKTTYGKGSSTVKNRTIYGQIVTNAALDDKVILTGGSTLTCTDGEADPFNFITCVARIGNEFYETFADAITAANASTVDAKVEFFEDITVGGTTSSESGNVKITNTNDVEITIDGHGHTVYTKAKHAISIRRSGTVNLQNMNIIHTGYQSALQVAASNAESNAINAVVNVTDVDFTVNNTTDTNIAQYGLILVPNVGSTTLNFLRTDVTMTGATGTHAVLRTGNNGDSKNVDITLEDCEWNVSATSGRRGIQLMSATAGTLELIDSTIHTKDATPIYDNSGLVEITKTRATLTCDNKEVQIGNDLKSFADAITLVNSSEENITVEILKDISTTSQITFRNDNNGVVNTFDGNGHTITIGGTGNNSIVIYGSVDGKGTYEFKNIDFVQGRKGVLIQMNSEAAKTDSTTGEVTTPAHTTKEATLKLTNVNISNKENGGYLYGLITTLPSGSDVNMTLDLNKVNVTLTFDSDELATDTGIGAGVIRTGNNNVKNVTIRLTDCNFNLENAAQIKGILVTNSSNANIFLNDTDIKTKTVAPIHANASAGANNTITLEGDCTLDSVAAEYKAAPVQGYDVQVGNKYYRTFAAALTGADAGATIKLLRNIDISNTKIEKSITIDGNGYTITSDEGTSSNKHLFEIQGDATQVTFRNISSLVHMRRGMIVSANIPTTLTMENVNIDATQAPVSNEYALFNLLGEDGTTNLFWDHVTVDMDATAAGKDSNVAIIRTGNTDEKVVNITLTDCDLNTEGAEGRHGITIISKTTATLNLTRTSITTLDVLPIKDNTGNATINTTDCTLTYTGIEAIIGSDNLYKTFAEALDAANASETDVTIEILKDITISGNHTIANENGKSITIEGHNHEVTAIDGQHTFMITTTQAGTVEFKNMTLKHKNHGSAVQIADSITGEKLTVKLTDVTIDATEPTNTTNGYDYTIINVLNKNTTDLVMTDVTITMSTDLPGKGTDPYWGIIRTGNGGTSNAKTVNMTLTNCTLNTSGATTRHGIVIVPNTTANIVLQNTTIKSKDVAPIKNYATTSQTITLDGCTFDATTEAYKTAPIEGYEAQVNDVVYGKFGDARLAANEAEESVTLKLLADLTVTQNVYINNANGKTITFDGDGHNVTTAGGSNNHAFLVGKDCTVKFENMTVYHKNRGSFVQVSENLDEVRLSLEHITIHATNPENEVSNYNYALINIFSSAIVNLTDVTVDMDATNSGADHYPGIIRTGNTGTVQKVDITLNECTLDTTGATGRHGIIIMKSTTATVNLLDTTITTMNAAPIVDYSTTATISKDEETTTSCNDEKYVAYVGAAVYETFADALKDANAATGDVILGLLQDVSVGTANIGNTKGKIIVDGNTHKITTENGNHAFNVNKNAEVEFRNMTIEHKRYGSAIQVTEDGAGATLTLTDVFLDATYPPQVKQSDDSYINTYNYALINLMASSTLNMTNTRVIMEVEALGAGGGNQSAIIRTGNKDSSDDTYKEITINITDCLLDATEATNRSGILVVDASAKINLKGNTQILTGAYNEGEKCAAIRGLEATRVAKISMDKTCVLMTGESTAYADVVKNIEAGITDACIWTYKKYDNITAFRTEAGLKAPKSIPTGYVFAGWYTDKSCTAEFALSQDDITTTSAYAKFVPEHVLGVKAQVPTYLKDGVQGDELGHIRFVTTVDSLDYLEIGFDYTITFNGVLLKEGTAGNQNNVVYRRLYAVGAKDGEVLDLIPEYTFCAVSQYFKAVTVTNIPEAAFDAAVTVTPFWITLDGTKVYGEPVTKTVNQGIESMNGDGLSNGSESEESVYTNRVVMVSDLHYTTSLDKETYDKNNKKYTLSFLEKYNPNASWAAGNAFGYSQEEKIQAALDDIHGFGANNTLDAVMVLGDLTLDDYGYRNLVDNYLDNFKKDFMDKLTYPSYAIAGNHDSYTNAEWKNTIGTDRQYSVVIGNAVFIMLDTFAAQHATSGSGSDYIGIDIDFLTAELNKAEYADKTIFLCSHYYQEGKHPEKDAALNALIKDDSRIVCMFRAHSHLNTTKQHSTLAGSPLVDIGGYAYNGQQEDDGSYDFNTFDKSWAWGYQVIEWNESEVHIYHVKPARIYTDSNGVVHNYKGAIEDDIVIKLSR